MGFSSGTGIVNVQSPGSFLNFPTAVKRHDKTTGKIELHLNILRQNKKKACQKCIAANLNKLCVHLIGMLSVEPAF